MPEWLVWWGIGIAVLLSIGIIGTVIFAILRGFRRERERFVRIDKRTHRRTWPND